MPILKLSEKLLKQMSLKGFNQQKLARAAEVSDSEVSRIVTGKSNPGLENAFRLARALDVSLDYLADDATEEDPGHEGTPFAEAERELLELGQAIGMARAARVLENVRIMGYEVAMRRLLLEAKPLIEMADGAIRPTTNGTGSTSRASLG